MTGIRTEPIIDATGRETVQAGEIQMTAACDLALCERPATEARKIVKSNYTTPWDKVDDALSAMADQLEAARAEMGRLGAEVATLRGVIGSGNESTRSGPPSVTPCAPRWSGLAISSPIFARRSYPTATTTTRPL